MKDPRQALKTAADRYVWAKFSPETAQRLVESWYELGWDNHECRDFAAEVVELLAEELKMRRADDAFGPAK